MGDDKVQLLDGPLGTELLARGVPTPLPGWSAHALMDAPDEVRAIHRDYALAGATVHTVNSFRTRRRVFPQNWRELTEKAVSLAREALVPGMRLAGSIAPLEDCYRPDLSPVTRDRSGTRAEHAELANVLAVGCDLILCETFPHVEEGLLALETALETGRECWMSFTPGYLADLLEPRELALGAERAVRNGASAVLVNCVPASRVAEYLDALFERLDPAATPIGCYANAGTADEKMGWKSAPEAPERYADLARAWLQSGLRIVGGCCGTGPAHTAALAKIIAEA